MKEAAAGLRPALAEAFPLNTKSFLSPLLSFLLLTPTSSWAQETSGPKSNLVQEAGSLKIVVIEGEGALNNIRSRTATQPVVEVRDENDRPVEGAEVVDGVYNVLCLKR